MSTPHSWLNWSRKLQSLAQDGLAFTTNPFDKERYHEIQVIAAEIIAANSSFPTEKVQSIFTAEDGYATPKVDVRGAVFMDGKILLVREMLDGGRWTVPGGWADPGEAPGEAVAREVWEETGYQVRVVKIAAVYDRDRHGHPAYFFTIYKLFFICELLGGEPVSSIETGESRFSSVNDLPELSIGRVTTEEILMLFRHHVKPEIPTEYD
jgi:ADP-ribose pyrophosphatase YjhB (NUDIX family)